MAGYIVYYHDCLFYSISFGIAGYIVYHFTDGNNRKFERQVYEGIRIQRERKIHHLLNSKSKFSRCALPRLEVKLGEEERNKRSKE